MEEEDQERRRERGGEGSELTFLNAHDSFDGVRQQHEDRSHREDLDPTSRHVEHERLHR